MEEKHDLVAWVFFNHEVCGKRLEAQTCERWATMLKREAGISRMIPVIGVDAITLLDATTKHMHHLKPQPGAGVTLSAFSIHEKLDAYEFTLSAPDLEGIEALLKMRNHKPEPAKRGPEFL